MNLYQKLKNWWNCSGKPRNRYGWIRDSLDHRDIPFNGDIMPVQVMPERVDLRPLMPAIYDQQSLGSCTANGIAGAFEYCLKKLGLTDFMPSRLFIYYNERDIEGTVNSDSGALIRDGIKSVNSIGVCSETDWPYDIRDFTWKPSATAYNNALKHKAIQYQKIFYTRPENIRLSLANGLPVVFGFTVFQSFETDQTKSTGIIPLPKAGESILGGHCCVIVGYLPMGALVPGRRHAICRNSWGTNWGDKGYFYMDFEFLDNPNYCDDFWSINVVT